MGYSQPYRESEKYLCLEHIADRYLRRELSEHTSEFSCSFCGKKGPLDEPFAVPLDALRDRIYETARWLFDDADNASYFEGRIYEDSFETIEVVAECAAEAIDPAVLEAVVGAIAEAIEAPESWIRSRFEDDFSFGWEDFAQTVQHESRFVFIGQAMRRDREDEPPQRLARFVEGILGYAEREAKMVVSLPPGSELFRGRMAHDAESLRLDMEDQGYAGALGPAPAELASAGRMNPQGIPFFYAGDSVRTAVAEIALHDPYDEAVVGKFVTQRELTILDLTRKPVRPSIFNREARRRYLFTSFVQQFVDAITAPVYLDRNHPVAYAPSQVVTEALRWLSPRPIDGIAFPSRAARQGKNYCLFFGPGDDFRTDPPSEREALYDQYLRLTQGQNAPTFLLAERDVSTHKVTRSVRVTDAGLSPKSR
jgi:hypothetical protein